MRKEEFDLILKKITERRFTLLEEKGKRYASEGDRLSAFKEGASLSGESPEKVLYSYLHKHIIALSNMIKKTEETKYIPSMEELLEITGDISNYMDLLVALYIELMGGLDEVEI